MRIPELIRRRMSSARRLAWYPPFRAMRVRVLELSEDGRRARLLLPLARNRNPGGGMFGGAIACLADPVAALACNRVFPGNRVWTRDLWLDFRHEGRTDLELRFVFDPDLEREIGRELAQRGRATPVFEYALFDHHDRVCVNVRNRVAIRPAGYRASSAKHRSRNDDERQ